MRRLTISIYRSLTSDRGPCEALRRLVRVDGSGGPGVGLALNGLLPPLAQWESADYFSNVWGRFRAIGIDETVLYWPQTWRPVAREDDVSEEVAGRIIPDIRVSLAT